MPLFHIPYDICKVLRQLNVQDVQSPPCSWALKIPLQQDKNYELSHGRVQDGFLSEDDKNLYKKREYDVYNFERTKSMIVALIINMQGFRVLDLVLSLGWLT